jgi:hypothetical protein
MSTKLPSIKTPARRGIDPAEARALAESEGLGILTTPDGPPPQVPRAADPVTPSPAEEVRLRRGEGLESFQMDVPGEILDALRWKALQEKTSVKALVLRSLHDSGYPVPEAFMRNRRKRKE